MENLKGNHYGFLRQLFLLFISCLIIVVQCEITECKQLQQKTFSKELTLSNNLFDHLDGNIFYQISPDGKQLAWLDYNSGLNSVYMQTIGKEDVTTISTRTWCNISWFKWAQDSRYIIYTLYTKPGRPQHIYLVDSHSPETAPVNLTPNAMQRAWFVSDSAVSPDHILLSQDKNQKGQYDFYKIDLKSQKSQYIVKNPDKSIIQWIPDNKGNLIACIRALTSGSLQLELFKPKRKTWKPLGTWKSDEHVECVGVSRNGKSLWLLSNKNRDRIGLMRFDVKSKKQTLICEDPDVDIQKVDISPVSGKALFAYAYPDYPKVYILDPQLKKDFEILKKDSPDGIQIRNMDIKEKKWIINISNDQISRSFLYDRATKKKHFFSESGWSANSKRLPRTNPVKIQSRDNLTLRGYLTRPTGKRNEPVPMVLYVHGGPWARDYWQPDRMALFLAHTGYAVLRVNYRGSKGYGRKFMQAAKKEFAKKMHSDLIDAVNWAVNEKIADPDKIAIVGGSYGGFAAMAGLTFTPDVFACAVSINGVSNWRNHIKSFPSPLPLYSKRGYGIWYEYVGNPNNIEDGKDIAKRSPINFVGRVKKPILIIYGDQDENVSPFQSITMIFELKKHEKNVVSMKFENEGHGIRWMHNSERMFKKIGKFLDHHLGDHTDILKGAI